jgi:hypothetical protein
MNTPMQKQTTIFQPTWLMVKRHTKTGLKYLCKTVKHDYEKYLGSGHYWKRHLQKHGKHVETIWARLFTDKDELVEFALFVSEVENICEALDINGKKLWANEIPENGLDGGAPGTKRGEKFQEKMRIHNKGDNNPSAGKLWWTNGKDEKKQKNSPGPEWEQGRSEIKKKQMGTARKGKATGLTNTKTDKQIYHFIHDSGKQAIMIRSVFRYHFDLCKVGVRELVTGKRHEFKGWRLFETKEECLPKIKKGRHSILTEEQIRFIDLNKSSMNAKRISLETGLQIHNVKYWIKKLSS